MTLTVGEKKGNEEPGPRKLFVHKSSAMNDLAMYAMHFFLNFSIMILVTYFAKLQCVIGHL